MCGMKSKVHVDLGHEATMLICVYDEQKRLNHEEKQRKQPHLEKLKKRPSWRPRLQLLQVGDQEGTLVSAGLSVLTRPRYILCSHSLCLARSET